MSFYILCFYLLCVICALSVYYTWTHASIVTDAEFKKFQRIYLVVYILAMAGDWLQGPYVYALYASYGMGKKDIELLFVAGFGASMIIGTCIGSIADRYGRRTNCIIYAILYSASCVTKHFNNFWILLLGRLLGGTATSILYSAFESWVIYEHGKRGFDKDLLGTIFSHACLGNSLVAIVSGVVAQYAADVFGFTAPFDVAICVLTLMCIFVVSTWTENYGDTSANMQKSFKDALNSILTDRKVLCLGIIQSLFEGSMYCFVLEWTPALTPPILKAPALSTQKGVATDKAMSANDGHRGKIPHGYVFAGFMVAIMVGSSIFKLLMRNSKPESFMRGVFLVSAFCMAVPILLPSQPHIIFVAFLVFEVCVGLFWPSLSTMRGQYVPEETRATIMNFFRIPLNLIVVIILSQNLSLKVVFISCVAFLAVSALCQHWLFRMASMTPDVSRVIHDPVKSQAVLDELKEAVETDEMDNSDKKALLSEV